MESIPSTCAIMVFAKSPQLGRVKTRLIPAIGAPKATQLHSAMVVQSVSVAVGTHIPLSDVQLWCTPDTGSEFFQQLQRDYKISLHQQTGSDLGNRMFEAFGEALRDHNQAVIIGTDCPTMTSELITQAFQALTDHDVVLAPAEDGGYVLLGLKQPIKELFIGINWGADQVYAQTITRVQQLELSWKALPPQWDVDRPADLVRLTRVDHRYDLHPGLREILASLANS